MTKPTGNQRGSVPGRVRDLTGLRFGIVVAERRHPENTKWGAARWECRCDTCGQVHVYPCHHLVHGRPPRRCPDRIRRDVQAAARAQARREAGLPTYPNRLIDLTGQRFNHLVVERRSVLTYRQLPGSTLWVCRCDLCGGQHSYRSEFLRKKPPKKCPDWWRRKPMADAAE